MWKLLTILDRYNPLPSNYFIICCYLQLIPNLQLHHLIIFYVPHEHLPPLYIIYS
jgi:hypothetical protein